MACLYSSVLSFSLSLSDILSLSVDISICASSLRSSCSVLRMVPRPCEEAPTAPTLLPPSCPHAPDVLFMSLQKSSRSARLLCTCDRSIDRSPSSRGSPTASIFNYMERWYLLPLFLCETLPAFVTQDGPGGLQRRDWPGRVQGFRSVQGFQSILFLRFKTRRRRHCVRVTYSGTRRSVKLSNWLACRLAKKSTSIKLPRNIC